VRSGKFRRSRHPLPSAYNRCGTAGLGLQSFPLFRTPQFERYLETAARAERPGEAIAPIPGYADGVTIDARRALVTVRKISRSNATGLAMNASIAATNSAATSLPRWSQPER
jgi:hypothetical protein